MRADKWGVDVRHVRDAISERLAEGRRFGVVAPCVVCAEWGQDSESDWTGRFWFCGEFVRGSLCNDCAAVARGAADSLGGFGLFGGGK